MLKTIPNRKVRGCIDIDGRGNQSDHKWISVEVKNPMERSLSSEWSGSYSPWSTRINNQGLTNLKNYYTITLNQKQINSMGIFKTLYWVYVAIRLSEQHNMIISSVFRPHEKQFIHRFLRRLFLFHANRNEVLYIL